MFRFSWQLFICVHYQPVHSNSAISLATMKWAKNCLFLSAKIHIYVNKTQKKINQWACYNRIWSWSPMPCEKHGPRASVTTKTSAFGLGFCLLSPSGHVFHTPWETMIKSYIRWLGHHCFSNGLLPCSKMLLETQCWYCNGWKWTVSCLFDVFISLNLLMPGGAYIVSESIFHLFRQWL